MVAVPGKDYGPGGKWIHDRARRIMKQTQGQYGSDAEAKSIAYATATQQAHKVGKSPKGFRTSEGVQVAKAKHDRPTKEYQKTAARWDGFFDELTKLSATATTQIGRVGSSLSAFPKGISRSMSKGIKPPTASAPKGPSSTGPSSISGSVKTPSESALSPTKGLAPPMAT
ncbi:MAG: hypothetical protein ABH877_04835 [bacterium]